MRKDWNYKKIGEIANILNGGTPKTKVKEYWNGKIAWITPADLGKLKSRYINSTTRTITELGLKKSSAKTIPPESIILSTRAPIGHLGINKIKISTNQGCRGIIPSKQINVEFLYYYLLSNVSLLNSLGNGATFKELSTKSLTAVPIPIPPLSEQKQIVALLDKAFAAIDQAKANIEKNIQNARELFQSKLDEVFLGSGEGWIIRKFSDCFKLSSGNNLTAKKIIPGKYPVYGGNGIVGYHSNYNLNGEQIIIGRVGAQCGNVHYINKPIWLTDNAFKITKMMCEFNFEFLTYLLNYKNLRRFARHTAQPVISNSSLKEIKIRFPESTEVQIEITKLIKKIETFTLDSISKYVKKIKLLEELKKSILEKAFKGELTVSNRDFEDVLDGFDFRNEGKSEDCN